jgi:hypothetical protein
MYETGTPWEVAVWTESEYEMVDPDGVTVST